MCARLHKEGQYCRVCGRVWHYGASFEGAQCDGCDFWIHDSCDPKMDHALAAPTRCAVALLEGALHQALMRCDALRLCVIVQRV